LDPELALTQPVSVRAASGFDAITHVLETWVTTKRNEFSDLCAREAWRLISRSYERYLVLSEDIRLVAWAIEHSMLGAAHACSNPLTRRYGAVHAHALATVLPHVLRFNADLSADRYADLDRDLFVRIEEFLTASRLPRTLRDLGANVQHLEELAEDAAGQWTGRHNPRPFDAASALEIYRCAF
jgi:alcohol dehydrogenase